MSERIQWEYRALTVGSGLKRIKDNELEILLNELGEDGWEVVGFRSIENSSQSQIIAKRPLDRAARRMRSMP
jgi:hypothetical protein